MMAAAIVAHRGNGEFTQIGDLFKVSKVEKSQSAPTSSGNRSGRSSSGRGNESTQNSSSATSATGVPIFDDDRIRAVIDYCKVGEEDITAGRININTAPGSLANSPQIDTGLPSACAASATIFKA